MDLLWTSDHRVLATPKRYRFQKKNSETRNLFREHFISGLIIRISEEQEEWQSLFG